MLLKKFNDKMNLYIIFLLLLFLNNNLAHVVNVYSSNYQDTMDFCEKTNQYWPTTEWLESTPETQGMDSNKLEQMKFSIQNQSMAIHSVIVVRNNYIVFEEYFTHYTQDTLHSLYSVTKSFISALIDLAIQKGFIKGVDQKVVEFFPEKSIANLDARKKSITLENLLTMSSGLEWDEWTYPYYDSRNDNYKMVFSGDCVQYVLDLAMINDPGVAFNYNSGGSHLLSAIIQLTTGYSTLEFAQKYLFTPLGISKAHWTRDHQGVCYGGGGLSLTPRDMAKFGYLYLKSGIWGNESLISKEWVNKSTSGLISTQFNSSYGYQWWVLNSRGIYFASGIKGQNIMVIPEENLIIVFTANLEDIGFDPEYQLLQDYILSAIVNSPTSSNTEPISTNTSSVEFIETRTDDGSSNGLTLVSVFLYLSLATILTSKEKKKVKEQ